MSMSQPLSSANQPQPFCHSITAGNRSHRRFVELLDSLCRVSRDNAFESDALQLHHKRLLQRAILAIGAMLADTRTQIAGEPLSPIPNGVLSSMEFELIAMDLRNAAHPANALYAKLDDIHRQVEALNAQLMQ